MKAPEFTSIRDDDATLKLRLYLAGDAPNSVAALANLRAVLAAHPECRVDLELINVLTEPHRGLEEGVFVTPMLVRVGPPPERRVLGNLRDRATVLGVLGLDEVRDE